MRKEDLQPSDIEIKDATSADAEEIVDVLRTTWLAIYPNEEYGITREDIEQRFDYSTPQAGERLTQYRERINRLPDEHEWLAKEGDRIVGWCFAKRGDENHIQTLYVLPRYQRRRIGERLLIAALDWIGPGKEVSLNIVSYNQNMGFYKRYGFVDMGKAEKNDFQPLPSGARFPENKMIKR